MSIEDTVRQSMPGWRLAKSQPQRDATPLVYHAEAFSPSLNVLQAHSKAVRASKKASVAVVSEAVRESASRNKGESHADFVIVEPENQPDNAVAFQKVVLVQNGRVIAQQG